MRVRSLVASVALAAVAAGCGDDSDDAYGPGGGGSGASVSVVNNAFTPGTLNLSGGSTVTWTWNSGGQEHNVTFDDGIGSSGNKSSGTHQRTFTAPGTYGYQCTIHQAQGMSGSVVVPTSPYPGPAAASLP